MPNHTQTDYELFAQKNGLELSDVTPLSLEDRLTRLETELSRTDVPYPIAPHKRAPYIAAAKAGLPFRTGNLGTESVALGDYESQQHYEKYTFEEHLSWACLVAQQKKTKEKLLPI